MANSPIASWQLDGETMETVTDFIFLGSKITADGDWSHEIKRLYDITYMWILNPHICDIIQSFNFMAPATICSDFGAPKNK
uniref:hypothetical protein n=1 Tax=Pseudomonas aeruginosa TaxID=287 RepID=UPI003CE9DC78